MHNNVIPKRDPDCLLEQIGNDYQIRHRDKATAIFINSTAALLWELFDGSRTVGDTKQMLQQAYPDAVDTINEDVDEALAMLCKHQALSAGQ